MRGVAQICFGISSPVCTLIVCTKLSFLFTPESLGSPQASKNMSQVYRMAILVPPGMAHVQDTLK